MKVVYTYVVGDLFHIGHLKCLQQAKALGDFLIVGVLTDSAVAAYKRTPIIPFEERLEIIKNIKCVDDAIRQEELNPASTIQKMKVPPDILVHGDDWDENFPGAEYMRSIGKRAERVKWYPGRPTTAQIAYLQGYMRAKDEANTETS